MSRLISAILYHVSFKRYLRYRSGRVLSGKEITPVVYRPRIRKPARGGLSR